MNIDLDNPGLHSIPICDEHYTALEHLMVCAMCKRTLATNHIHHLGMEMNELNNVLDNMGIPIKLNDKPVVCKLCRYFANILLKLPEERPENNAEFINEYKKRFVINIIVLKHSRSNCSFLIYPLDYYIFIILNRWTKMKQRNLYRCLRKTRNH